MRTTLLLAAVLASACGDDLQPPPAPPGAKPSANTDSKRALAASPQIEARVTDAEKATIRHTLVDQDFVASATNRDPFAVGGGQQTPLQRSPTANCRRADQFVAASYSFTDLRLVGIVASNTQRRALMMDAANVSHVLKKGDCVGYEQARVDDVGDGYVSLLDDTAQVHSIRLYP